MFRELLSRESRIPPLLGTGLAAILMGGVAVASAQASLPSRSERLAAAAVAAKPIPADAPHETLPNFAFAEPLAGFAMNSPFGLRKLPWEEGGRLHQGVDIAAPSGTPVRATLAGVVVRSGVDGGYGRFVEVRHPGGLTSLYAHLGRFNGLRTGQLVGAGEVVGFVGSTGRSTGAHLHFEIRYNGKPMNPAQFIGQTFMTEADLPLTEAMRVSRRVRVAQVAAWPRGVVSRAAPKAGVARPATTPLPAEAGRVRARIMPPEERAALIRSINAAQRQADAATPAVPAKATPTAPKAASSTPTPAVKPASGEIVVTD